MSDDEVGERCEEDYEKSEESMKKLGYTDELLIDFLTGMMQDDPGFNSEIKANAQADPYFYQRIEDVWMDLTIMASHGRLDESQLNRVIFADGQLGLEEVSFWREARSFIKDKREREKRGDPPWEPQTPLVCSLPDPNRPQRQKVEHVLLTIDWSGYRDA